MIEHRGGANGDGPFKLAVKELVARRVLHAYRAKGGWFSGPVTRYALVDGPLIDADVAPVLEPVRSAYRDARRRSMKRLRDDSPLTGVAMRDLLKTGRRQLGGVDGYLDLHLRPALVERGLIERSARKDGGPPDFDWTAAGRQADDLLHEWLALARSNLARLATSDLLTGAKFVAGAGCALLFLEDHHPELVRLGQRIQHVVDRALDQAAVGSGSLSGHDGPLNHEGAALELDLSRIANFYAVPTVFGAIVGPSAGPR